MKTFKQFLAEQESDTFVYCFGRMNPPTKGHLAHLQEIKQFAQSNNIPYTAYISKTVDNKKNPIPFDVKIAYIKKAIPDLEIQPAVNMFKLLDDLIPRGYKRIIYFAGGDYFEEGSQENIMFDRLVAHAAQQGVELVAKSSGNRTAGISGTALRQAVASGDFETFKSASPLGIGGIVEQDVQEIFNLCRQALQVK
jgi:hypothetical protein